MKPFTAIMLLSSIIHLTAGSAAACDCANPGAQEKVERDITGVVFLGEAVKVRGNFFGPADFPTLIRFKVEKQWKGKTVKEIEIPMAFDMPKICGDFDFLVGRKYLVYAYRKGPHRDKSNLPELWTSADCTPNVEAENAAEEMRKLDEILKKQPR